MKRVLIITYYWPPSGGSGVQRWLKMSKYLPENGWQPVVYTPENPESPVEDLTLESDVCAEAEVVKTHIFEPYSFYKKFVGVKKDEKVKMGLVNEGEHKSSWKERLTLWIRGNLFIPDARRWWVKPSVRFLKKYLKEHPVDAIITTGPPHSMHLIGMKLHDALDIPWMADFRDPWTEIDYYQDLHLTRHADRKHHRLEGQVLSKADRVIAIGWDMAESFKRLGAQRVEVVTNGYDWDTDTSIQHADLSEKFTLSHIGLLGPTRNIPTFWRAISELAERHPDFRQHLDIQLIGQVDISALRLIETLGLKDVVTHLPHIPHDEVMQKQCASRALLLFINNTPNAKGILTGKLFEYLSSGRPVLCIGPEDGDAAHIISEAKAGATVGFDDKDKMEAAIMQLFDDYRNGEPHQSDMNVIKRYSRQEQSRIIADTLNEMTKDAQ